MWWDIKNLRTQKSGLAQQGHKITRFRSTNKSYSEDRSHTFHQIRKNNNVTHVGKHSKITLVVP